MKIEVLFIVLFWGVILEEKKLKVSKEKNIEEKEWKKKWKTENIYSTHTQERGGEVILYSCNHLLKKPFLHLSLPSLCQPINKRPLGLQYRIYKKTLWWLTRLSHLLVDISFMRSISLVIRLSWICIWDVWFWLHLLFSLTNNSEMLAKSQSYSF